MKLMPFAQQHENVKTTRIFPAGIEHFILQKLPLDGRAGNFQAHSFAHFWFRICNHSRREFRTTNCNRQVIKGTDSLVLELYVKDNN
jgi:hypothetical protein